MEFDVGGLQLPPFQRQAWYTPRIWYGMDIRDWWRLLTFNRLRVHYRQWALATAVTPFTLLPVLTNGLQRWLYQRDADATPLVDDPIFLIGHWRCGTTYLHEILGLDSRLAYPTTFQCFNPLSCLVTQSWLRPITRVLLPKRRPMDNLAFGWDGPQEDEFALLTMGVPSPYRRIAWPNVWSTDREGLDLTDLTDEEQATWEAALCKFLKYLNLHYERRLVLKSPPHTARIRTLLRLFPNARFVHLTRDPYRIIPSTMHMWAALDFDNALHPPDFKNLQECVFARFEKMYAAFARDVGLLSDKNHMTVRYDDLVDDTEAVVCRIYDQLGLGDVTPILPQLRERITASQDYQKNPHQLTDALRDEIAQRCDWYFKAFDYSKQQIAA